MAPKKSTTAKPGEENTASVFGEEFTNPFADESSATMVIESDAPVADAAAKVEIATDEKVEEKKEELSEETKEKFLRIFDQIMFEGQYTEVFHLSKRYKVRFRSRSSGEEMTISQRLDTMTFNTLAAYSNQASLLTLAYATLQFGNDDLEKMTVKERYEYITKLPAPIIPALSKKLIEFDDMITKALEYGQENF